MIRLYVDASTKGNPGPCGVGIVILKNQEQLQISQPLVHNYTNHEAEFIALITGLNILLEHHWENEWVSIHSDSKIVVQSIEKQYTKKTEFQKLLKGALQQLQKFPLHSLTWIPEKQNQGADHLARQALQKRLKEQKNNTN